MLLKFEYLHIELSSAENQIGHFVSRVIKQNAFKNQPILRSMYICTVLNLC